MAKIKTEKEDWINKKWRPMMAVMYMIVCIFDFIIFPIMFTVVQFWETQAANDAFRQWQPLTLIGAGLFHMAMGAVLGITAWSRGQEKIAGVSTNPNSLPITQNTNSFGSSSSFNPSTSSSFNQMSMTPNVSPSFNQVQFSSSGKAMVPQDFPER
jgi:hypothetical protein